MGSVYVLIYLYNTRLFDAHDVDVHNKREMYVQEPCWNPKYAT